MDKRVVVAELRNIFNLLNACFDTKALLSLISKKKREERHRLWNRAIKQVAKEAGIDVPVDFKPEEAAYRLLKNKNIGSDQKDEVVDWIFAYMFYPKSLDKENVQTLIERFEGMKEKNPTGEHNFAGFLVSEIPNTIRMYFRERSNLGEGGAEESKGKKEIPSAKEVKELAIKDMTHSPEKIDQGVGLMPSGYMNKLEKHLQKLHGVKDLAEDAAFKQLKDVISKWFKDHANALENKVMSMLLDIPDSDIKSIATALNKSSKAISNVIHKDIRKHFVELARELKEETGDNYLYEKLKDLNLPELKEDYYYKSKSSEERIASIIEYIKILEDKIV